MNKRRGGHGGRGGSICWSNNCAHVMSVSRSSNSSKEGGRRVGEEHIVGARQNTLRSSSSSRGEHPKDGAGGFGRRRIGAATATAAAATFSAATVEANSGRSGEV